MTPSCCAVRRPRSRSSSRRRSPMTTPSEPSPGSPVASRRPFASGPGTAAGTWRRRSNPSSTRSWGPSAGSSRDWYRNPRVLGAGTPPARASGSAAVPRKIPGSSSGGSRRGCSTPSSPRPRRARCSRERPAAGSRSSRPPSRPAARRRAGRSSPGSARSPAGPSSRGCPASAEGSASTAKDSTPPKIPRGGALRRWRQRNGRTGLSSWTISTVPTT